ncbi:hypothetical protein [Streptomyces sp. NPDC055400]
MPDPLACSDVMGTGWWVAIAAAVQKGDTVAVVGDGADQVLECVGTEQSTQQARNPIP